MMIRVRYAVAVFVLLALSLPLHGQFGAGIEGTVTDQSGAVVKGAKVTVTDQGTGVSHTTSTGDSGYYSVQFLPPGRYTVSVEAVSFAKNTIRDVVVTAENTRGLNLVLKAGQAQESVTVTAEATTLATENASISGNIEALQLENLPSFGRDPYELLRLAPGVFGDTARGATGNAAFFPNVTGVGASNNSLYQVENQPQVSANGQRVTENNFMIDGVDINSLTNGGSAIITPSAEAIAGITVFSSTYSAEDGRNSGAQIKVTSKTGTNNFHGSGFFKYDEPGLNAFNDFGGFQSVGTNPFGALAPNVKDENKARNYGGSVGGPIRKDKVFFFFSYEGEHAYDQSFGINYIPTPQFIQQVMQANPNSIAAKILSAPGGTPRVATVLTPNCGDINGPCQVVPGGLDLGSPKPSGSAPGNPYLPLNPNVGGAFIGNGFDGIPDLELAQLVYPNPHTGNQFHGRVDWTINSQHTVALSTFLTSANSINPPGTDQTSAANRDVTNTPFSPAGTVLWNWIISPKMLNEVRFNFSRFGFDEIASNQGTVNWAIPDVEIQDILKNGRRVWFGVPQGENTPGLIAQNTFGFGDTVSKMLSKQTLKFGLTFRREQSNNSEVGFARPLFTFSHLWNFANDAPIFEQNAVNPKTGSPDPALRNFRSSYFGGFIQDDWKFRPNLTLNAGLRYEYYSPVSEPNGLMSNLLLAGTGPTAIANATLVTGDSLYSTPKGNFAPRLGFAWSPNRFQQKIVLRGGFGIYYDPVGEAVFDPARENPPFHALEDNCCGTAGAPFDGFGTPFDGGKILYALGSSNSPLSYPGNPVLGGGIGPNGLPPGCCVQVYFEPKNFRLPYVYGFSLETQFQLPAKTVATLGYQGSSTHHQVRIYDANLVFDAPSTANVQVNPAFFISPDTNANYHSLNARVERSFANGFQAAIKYRWSKSLDQVSYGQPDASVNETFPRDLRTEYGPSDYDAKHFVVLSGFWDLPIFRNKKEGIEQFLGGWQLSGVLTYHTGFPWTAVDNNCLQTPGQQFICPIRPSGYNGKAGNSTSNDTFLTPNGNFPGGGPNFFTLTPGPPGVGRNSFRGPNYQSIDMTFGKTTRLPSLGEGGNLQIRLNAFNVFNRTNLSPFGFNTPSTVIQSPYFGTAGTTPALAGRVLELQARVVF